MLEMKSSAGNALAAAVAAARHAGDASARRGWTRTTAAPSIDLAAAASTTVAAALPHLPGPEPRILELLDQRLDAVCRAAEQRVAHGAGAATGP